MKDWKININDSNKKNSGNMLDEDTCRVWIGIHFEKEAKNEMKAHTEDKYEAHPEPDRVFLENWKK